MLEGAIDRMRSEKTYEQELQIIGHRIAHVRKQLGFSQIALATKSGVSMKFLSMVEHGENISLKTLLALTNAMGIDLKDILRTQGLRQKGPGRRSVPIATDDRLQDATSRELLRRLALLDEEQRRRILMVFKTALEG